jgi:hypothetical protein
MPRDKVAGRKFGVIVHVCSVIMSSRIAAKRSVSNEDEFSLVRYLGTVCFYVGR